MVVSSRTPEGQPNECPICRKAVCIEPSLPFGDATCPNCGHLLWFLQVSGDARIFPHSESVELRERILRIIAEHLGVTADEIESNPQWTSTLGADSLDVVELVMELEEEVE